MEADINNCGKGYLIMDEISAVTLMCLVLGEPIAGGPAGSGSDRGVGCGAGGGRFSVEAILQLRPAV